MPAGLGVMDLCVAIKGVSSLLPTGKGILGNSLAVLLAYAHIIYTEPRLLLVDMILCHPAFCPLMLLLTCYITQTMTVFQLRVLFNDLGCKSVIIAYWPCQSASPAFFTCFRQ